MAARKKFDKMNDTVEYRLSESKNSNTAVHTYLFRPAEPAPRKNKVYAVGFIDVFIPFIAAIGGFEYAHYKNRANATVQSMEFRRRFYKISAWLGLYFPVRFLMNVASTFYPRPYSSILFEVMVLVVYIFTACIVNLAIDKQYIMKLIPVVAVSQYRKGNEKEREFMSKWISTYNTNEGEIR